MILSTKGMQITAAAVVAVGIGTAAVLGGTHSRKQATIAAGTELVASLEAEVSTDHSRAGDVVTLRTVQPIRVWDGGEIPAGATVHGTVGEAKGGGRIAGAPELTLRFTELELDGESYPLAAESFHMSGRNDAGKSAAEIGGGAVAGGILGRVVGGKGGTLPGAVVGAAIGTGVAMQSEGDELVLHKGQLIRVRLSAPVTVTYRESEGSLEARR
jgi:hypothetical protein